MDWGAKTFRHCTMHSWPISRIEVVPSYDTCCDLAIVQKISSHLIVCVYTVNVHHIKRAILQFRKCCIASGFQFPDIREEFGPFIKHCLEVS